jgi:hypothetical protein
LELEFFVFLWCKAKLLGGNRQFNPWFPLDIETWHTSTGTHLSSQCWTHFDKWYIVFHFFSWLCILMFSHNSFLKELLLSHKRKPCVLGPQCTNTHHPPSTGCLLLLSSGWTSTELIFGFTLVTNSVRNRSHILINR